MLIELQHLTKHRWSFDKTKNMAHLEIDTQIDAVAIVENLTEKDILCKTVAAKKPSKRSFILIDAKEYPKLVKLAQTEVLTTSLTCS